jgi:ATP-dependent helicase Lhr and Lhr-like helicase
MKPHPQVQRWFAAQGWQIFAFQKQVWAAAQQGRSGLIHATTGSGKTYAAWFATLNQALHAQKLGEETKPGLRVLWITPMRALASDTTKALQAPLDALGLPWTVGQRTGDTNSSERAKQSKQLPHALVTTPESLSLMLSRAETRAQFKQLQCVVLDEWHELMGNKRGVQVQLALARLRRWNPKLLVWGLSATLGNTEHAMQALMPVAPTATDDAANEGLLVRGVAPKALRIDTLLPPSTERFPWGGHLGLRMLPLVVQALDESLSTLVFTNTRSQAELWYNALLEARPDWAGLIALHHGSLDRDTRDWVEANLKSGTLKAVVCTSSLDLGVDFSPVARVLQIGSAKGVARVLQRAGRSGHAPGQTSRITLVPTHALELVEGAALQDAAKANAIEARTSPDAPLDVLVQHVVTIAAAGDTSADDLFSEVKSSWAYRDLSSAQWQWVLGFAGHGGDALKAYPDYQRIVHDAQGLMVVASPSVARRHRMSIGTIVSDASMLVRYFNGAKIGTVEESFISRLKKGQCFLFAGRLLELVRVQDMTAYVKRASGPRAATPRWAGGTMPLSSELAHAFMQRLAQAQAGQFVGPEMQLVKPLLQLQAQWSSLPTGDCLVAEAMTSREGHHLFVYPVAGRHVHLGLSSLLAWRLAQVKAATFSIAVNDYGFELLSATPVDWLAVLPQGLTHTDTLAEDVTQSLNASELVARRFREIARVSGLVQQGFPGAVKSNKQLQASSGLLYEVFCKYDPQNLLLAQAKHEVLSQALDMPRLRSSMASMAQRRFVFHTIERPTPFAFPLMIERLREKLSNEKLSDRVARMVRELEKAATP